MFISRMAVHAAHTVFRAAERDIKESIERNDIPVIAGVISGIIIGGLIAGFGGAIIGGIAGAVAVDVFNGRNEAVV
jgi:hypothetical protein